MSINVILQTVDGKKEEEVTDPDYSLANVWPVGDNSFPLLQYIDPYGNVVFKGQQMPEVRKELDILLRRVSPDEQKEILIRICALVTRCQDHPHRLLRFRGD